MSNHVAPILGLENLVTSLDKDWYAHRLILLAPGRRISQASVMGGWDGGKLFQKQNLQLEA